MDFTGERMVPGKVDAQLLFEHVSRYQFALDYADGKDVLDVACGTGYGCYILASKARSVIGVDISNAAVEFASENYSQENIEFKQADALNLPLRDDQFDLVVAFEIMEHLHVPTGLFYESNRVTKSGGIIIISTPNKEFFKSSVDNPFHVIDYGADEFSRCIEDFFNGDIEFFSQVAKSRVSGLKQTLIQLKRKANIGPIMPKKIKEILEPDELLKLKTPYEFVPKLNENAEFFIAVIKSTKKMDDP